MIYVSSSCMPARRIGEAVQQLAEAGFRQIELSGGSFYYEDWLGDLQRLKQEFGLQYRLHNYFPPPPRPFTLNLASLNEEIFNRSLAHCKSALQATRALGGEIFSLHAGMYFDPVPDELGAPLSQSVLFPRDQAMDQFIHGLRQLQEEAGDIRLLVENHVLSGVNARTFSGENPLMLTTAEEYHAFHARCGITLLLDLAHLHVTSHTLGLSYEKEAESLLAVTDQIHLSGNDGLADDNRAVSKDSPVMKPLLGRSLLNRTITIEVYGGLEQVVSSWEVLKSWSVTTPPCDGIS